MYKLVASSVRRGVRNNNFHVSNIRTGRNEEWKSQSGLLLVQWRNGMSSVEKEEKVKKKKDDEEDKVVVSNYWGITRPKIKREDGTDWPWNCFMPWETYRPDLSIDMSKHHVPKNFLDKFAYRTVKILRIPTDVFFQRRYGCRAMMLETVAAVPGMVGGMLLHLRSLRKFEQSGGWIKALLEEAENERMHLMTMVELVQPKWYEGLLVISVQVVFFNAFFWLYMSSPKLAHRIVGYLEEEAIHSYTEFLKDRDGNLGPARRVPGPARRVWAGIGTYFCISSSGSGFSGQFRDRAGIGFGIFGFGPGSGFGKMIILHTARRVPARDFRFGPGSGSGFSGSGSGSGSGYRARFGFGPDSGSEFGLGISGRARDLANGPDTRPVAIPTQGY